MLLKLLQPLSRLGSARIHAVNLDPMTTARDMQTPVPTVSNRHGLRVETVIPAADNEFGPAFVVAWDGRGEGAPGELVFLGEVLDWDWIPDVAAIRGYFDTFGPAATT